MEYEIRTFSTTKDLGRGRYKRTVLHRVIEQGHPQNVLKESPSKSVCELWLQQHSIVTRVDVSEIFPEAFQTEGA